MINKQELDAMQGLWDLKEVTHHEAYQVWIPRLISECLALLEELKLRKEIIGPSDQAFQQKLAAKQVDRIQLELNVLKRVVASDGTSAPSAR